MGSIHEINNDPAVKSRINTAKAAFFRRVLFLPNEKNENIDKLLQVLSTEPEKRLRISTKPQYTKVSWLMGAVVHSGFRQPSQTKAQWLFMTDFPSYSYGIAGDLHSASFEIYVYLYNMIREVLSRHFGVFNAVELIVKFAYTLSERSRRTELPSIKPVSDLRNYTEVLKDITVGNPVFLTRDGKEKYVLLDMADYEKTQAGIKLMTELAKGRKSGEEQGWETIESIEAALGI
jgi:PHD/YefM family antitoxin component YafN of YafNO toxin-antitoxin module